MTRSGGIGGLAALALLAGCAGAVAPGAPQVQVTMTGGVAAPEARRHVEAPVVARAGGAEVAAKCRLQSPYYSASFTAPARLVLPDYGRATPAVKVACAAGGAEGAVEVAPGSKGQQTASVVGGALFGVVGAVAAHAMAADNDSDHFYPPIVVRLE